jgi:alkaline phosphatase D
MVYGNLAIFVMDLRSSRHPGEAGQLFSRSQEEALRAFLCAHRQKPLLFIVVSVPVVHLPPLVARWMARFGPDSEDFADRWSTGAHLRDRDRFLTLLCTHQQQVPEQRVVLLSGDIHIGCAHEIRWHNSNCRFYQFVSSGITHSLSGLVSLAARLSIRYTRRLVAQNPAINASVHFLPGVDGHTRNPYSGLNLGLIEVETPAPGATPQMRFLLYSHDGDEPRCVYRSALL